MLVSLELQPQYRVDQPKVGGPSGQSQVSRSDVQDVSGQFFYSDLRMFKLAVLSAAGTQAIWNAGTN